MSRPQKPRRIYEKPFYTYFAPLGVQNTRNIVEMTLDEYEAIRLIDIEGFTQEMCAKQMEVGRTTVQSIYQSGRKKLAYCIVSGRTLIINGGKYRICE